MRTRAKAISWGLASLMLLALPAMAAPQIEHPSEPPMVSGGFEGYRAMQRAGEIRDLPPAEKAPIFPIVGFDAMDFDDNATENGGFVFIPPDPMGAAGIDRVIAVTNVMIEARTKAGALIFRDALRDFFSPAVFALGTFCFDPKIIFDQYENRFVVVALEQWDVAAGDPSDESRILLAVSKTATPASSTAADWWYYVINAKLVVGASTLWADYPGLEVDEEAVYVTSNMYNFSSSPSAYTMRLWIVNKGVAGGFYAGGPTAITLHDPYGATGIAAFATTTMPAHVYGPAGVGAGVGTFLVSYGGITAGGLGAPEFINVIRVNNPLGVVTFTQEFVSINDIEDIGGGLGWPALPDAPQPGGSALIEVNDRRALDAVWRNGFLYLTTTINPNLAYDPVNAGQTTAHWIQLDATAVTSSAAPPGLIFVVQEGDIGGEDIEGEAFTYFPAIEVNALDQMKVGFSASALNTFGGAYAAGRVPSDPPNTIGPSGVVRPGVDYYLRTFGGPRNRWGDYSGISVDPADGTTFWVFNEWADVRGTPIGGEDGRWGTAWLACTFGQPDLVVTLLSGPCCTFHGDVIGSQVACRIGNYGTSTAMGPFAVGFYVSADPVITPADVLLNGGREFVPSLGPGVEVVVPLSATASIPASAPLGQVYFGAIVDEQFGVPESDETNNTMATPITVGPDPYYCMEAFATTAAAPRQVSVFTSPDGTGNPLSAAQSYGGSSLVNATITVQIQDDQGLPVPGVRPLLFTTMGGLIACPGDAKADGPSNAAGIATFSGALYGGGYTDPVNGELVHIASPGGPFASVLYGQRMLYASDQFGNIYQVDHVSGAANPVCIVPPSATEIEYNPLTGLGFVQQSDGAFTGQEFLYNGCVPVAPPLFNGFAFNGLEWIGPRLYGAGISGPCTPSTLFVLDPLSGGTIPIGPTGDPRPFSGLAYDPMCRTMFAVTGCYNQFGPADLLRVDVNTGQAQWIGNTQLQLGSLEFGPDGQLYAGGGQLDGGNLWMIDRYSGTAFFVGPTGIPNVTGLALVSDPGLDIQFNSADINGDLLVNLADLGIFAADFNGGLYRYRSDYKWDGVLNLADVGLFASVFGAACPAVIPAKPPQLVAQGEIGLYFDAEGVASAIDLAAGTPVTAYLLVTGKAAQAGLLAWELSVETSKNVVLDEWSLTEGALDIGEGLQRIVGIGRELVAKDAALRLASVTLHVTDTAPAKIELKASAKPSLADARPVVSLGDRLAPLDTRGTTINGPASADEPVFTAVALRSHPNPFNPSTEIRFNLPRRGRAEVRIYDVSGREVHRLGGEVLPAGANALTWNGTDHRHTPVVNGVYFYRLFFEGAPLGSSEKMTLLK